MTEAAAAAPSEADEPTAVAASRVRLTDKLGLPALASNDLVLATLDAKLATKQRTAEDSALYLTAFGR